MFRDLLKNAMKRRKLSVNAACRLTEGKVAPSSVYRYLSGENEILAGNLESLLRAIQVGVKPTYGGGSSAGTLAEG